MENEIERISSKNLKLIINEHNKRLESDSDYKNRLPIALSRKKNDPENIIYLEHSDLHSYAYIILKIDGNDIEYKIDPASLGIQTDDTGCDIFAFEIAKSITKQDLNIIRSFIKNIGGISKMETTNLGSLLVSAECYNLNKKLIKYCQSREKILFLSGILSDYHHIFETINSSPFITKSSTPEYRKESIKLTGNNLLEEIEKKDKTGLRELVKSYISYIDKYISGEKNNHEALDQKNIFLSELKKYIQFKLENEKDINKKDLLRRSIKFLDNKEQNTKTSSKIIRANSGYYNEGSEERIKHKEIKKQPTLPTGQHQF